MNLSDKVALVTGSSRGIGSYIIKELAKNGCNVIINYNNSKDNALKLKQYIDDNYNVKSLVIKCDITNEEEIINMINKIISEFGELDILINNAVYECDNYIDEKTKEEFMKVLEVNLVGPFLVSKYAYKYMNNGIIVNISSKDAVSTYNDINIDYSVSKAGLNLLTKSLSLIIKNSKIISVMPGWVNTESVKEMNPDYLKRELKRVHQDKLSEVEDIAMQIINIIKDYNIKTGSIIELED